MWYSAVGCIVTLTLSLLVTPLCSDAQQPGKIYRIGYLAAGSPPLPSAPTPGWDAFWQQLRELGWMKGLNIVVEHRWAERRIERLPTLATELVQLQVDVILAGDGGAIAAAKGATSTIPIVMLFSLDAVEQGLVASLAHPGGNVTGVTAMNVDLNQKRLDLLKETVPGSARMTILSCDTNIKGLAARGEGWEPMQVTARALGVQLHHLEVREPYDYEGAFAAAIRERAEVIAVGSCYFNMFNRQRIVDLAAKHRLPAIYDGRGWVQAGGLMSYGPKGSDLWRRAATYVDKIRKGAKPVELPVEQPMKFELVINLKTAQTLGITMPPSLLLLADEVIQ